MEQVHISEYTFQQNMMVTFSKTVSDLKKEREENTNETLEGEKKHRSRSIDYINHICQDRRGVCRRRLISIFRSCNYP